ncbi:MAG: hypothetical protein ABSA57_17200 [Candidatus Acidiferrales bacterium]|jgi:hypothetical protein
MAFRFHRALWKPRRHRQGGFAYLMALFMVIALIITSEVAMENLLTTGRRQREEEMIWRGQQFVRAIRLYYGKTGHYPSTLDDLKKGMPELHFLRYAAYKDPMKSDDERVWRFIYVNASGQIIGSVRYASLQQMAILDLNGGKIPGATQGGQSDQPGVPVSSLADQSAANSSGQNPPNGANGQGGQDGQVAPNLPSTVPPSGASGTTPDNSGNAANSQQGVNSLPPGQNPQVASPTPTSAAGTPVAPGAINTNMGSQSLAVLAALKPTGPVDGPVLGGFLTGVGSAVDKPSIRVYNGGKRYNQWEFIWNPIEDQAKAVQQGLNPAGVMPGQPGQAIGAGAAGTSGNSGLGPAGPNGSNSTLPNPTSVPGFPSGPTSQPPQ